MSKIVRGFSYFCIMKQQEKIIKAADILKEFGQEQVIVCKFGIYYQYEMAGKRVSSYPFDEIENFDLQDKLESILDFIDEKFIYTKLGFPEEGQYNLLFNTNGEFSYEKFRI